MLNTYRIFKKKTALVLGGGAARGIAHLGVIDHIIKNNIKFDAIFGTSAGAIYGSLYAIHQNIEEALKKYKEVIEGVELPDFNDLRYYDESGIKKTLKNMYQSIRKGAWVIKGALRQSLIDRGMFEKILEVFYSDINLEDLPIKTYIIATDLVSGKDIIFTHGELVPIVQGSSSIIGVLPPVEYQNHLLVDGGTTAKLPVFQAIMLGYDKIIAVDVGSTFKEIDKFANVIEVFSRVEKISANRFHQENLRLADLVIRPQVDDIEWFDFKKTDIIFNRGLSKANEMGTDLKNLNDKLFIKRKRLKSDYFNNFCKIV